MARKKKTAEEAPVLESTIEETTGIGEAIQDAPIDDSDILDPVSNSLEDKDMEAEDPVSETGAKESTPGVYEKSEGTDGTEDAVKVEESAEEPAPVEEAPKKTKKTSAKKTSEKKAATADPYAAGTEINIDPEQPIWLFPASVGRKYIRAISGAVYIWSSGVVTDRVLVTDNKDTIGLPTGYIGWINVCDIKR